MKITNYKSEITNKSQAPEHQISNGCRLSFGSIDYCVLVLVWDLLLEIWDLAGPLLWNQWGGFSGICPLLIRNRIKTLGVSAALRRCAPRGG
jgi:hypothetical protein